MDYKFVLHLIKIKSYHFNTGLRLRSFNLQLYLTMFHCHQLMSNKFHVLMRKFATDISTFQYFKL